MPARPPFLPAASIHYLTTRIPIFGGGGKMLDRFRSYGLLILSLSLFIFAAPAHAQLGNSGSIDGVVKDPSGATVPNAKVEISNPVTGYHRETATDSDGIFHFSNIPFNPYHLTVGATGFSSHSQDVDVRSTVPTSVPISL